MKSAILSPLVVAVALVILLMAAHLSGQGMGGRARTGPRPGPPSTDRPFPPLKVQDVAAQWGIVHRNTYGGRTSKRFILEMTGNGVAVFDFDQDGRPDLFFANGAEIGKESEGQAGFLYRNERNGQFRDITRESGFTATGWAQGVCAGDLDNDGFPDLVLTFYGQNRLFRNVKGKVLEDRTATSGIEHPEVRWGTGCALLDYDRDGDLDLAVTNYLGFDPKKAEQPGAGANCYWKGLKVFCGPRGYPGGAVWLYRNEGGFRFTDVTDRAGVRLKGLHYALGIVSSDFDRDGWPDFYVAADSTPSLLFHNNGDGTFTESGVPAGVAYGEDGQEQGSMGVATGDIDGDGLPDLMATNFIDETPALYRNQGDDYFLDSTTQSGVGVYTSFVGWGVVFLDADLDGRPDILSVNGHIYPELEAAPGGEAFRQRKVLYWNLDGEHFLDIAPKIGGALMRPGVGRGLAIGDLDGDGIPEAIAVQQNEPPAVLQFSGALGHRAVVQLQGVKSNRSAIGARVTLLAGGVRQTQEVQGGSSYLSQNDFRLYFGLGAAEMIDTLEIAWPSGEKEVLTGLPAGALLRIEEGKGLTAKTALAAP